MLACRINRASSTHMLACRINRASSTHMLACRINRAPSCRRHRKWPSPSPIPCCTELPPPLQAGREADENKNTRCFEASDSDPPRSRLRHMKAGSNLHVPPHLKSTSEPRPSPLLTHSCAPGSARPRRPGMYWSHRSAAGVQLARTRLS